MFIRETIALFSAGLFILLAPPVAADTSIMLGVTWSIERQEKSDTGEFGHPDSRSKAGVTLKVLSSDAQGDLVVGAGVTRYFNGKIGCDLGAGYNITQQSLLASYDICQKKTVFSVGNRH